MNLIDRPYPFHTNPLPRPSLRSFYPVVLTALAISSLGLVFVCQPLWTSILSVLAVGLVLLYHRPSMGLYFIILFMPARSIFLAVDSPTRSVPEIISLVSLPVLAVFGAIVLNRVASQRDGAPRNELNTFMLLLALWAAISLFWTTDTVHGINMLVSLANGLLVLVIFKSLLRTKGQLKNLLHFAFLIGCACVILLTVSYWYYGSETIDLIGDVKLFLVFDNEEGRPGGFAPVNHASSILNFFIFVGFSLMYRAGALKRVALSVFILFMIFGVFFTGSKGGIGSLVLGLGFLITAVPFLRRRSWYMMPLVFVLILAMLIAVSIITGEGFGEQRTISSAAVASISIETRLEFWEKGFEYLKSSMGIGTGVGGFARFIDPWPGAHSFFFSLIFDLGVVGASIFVIMLVRILFLAGKTVLDAADDELKFISWCLIGSLVVFSIHSLVEADYIYFPFWLFLSMLLSVSNLSGERAPAPPAPLAPSAPRTRGGS